MNESNPTTFQSVAKASKLSYVGSKPKSWINRDPASWYTPVVYVDAARSVMGSIDLDPFSSEDANEKIKADRFFTEEVSAFTHLWNPNKKKYPHGLCVWMNPPYTVGLIQKAVETFLKNWKGGNITQAVILVNNATDTNWFASLRECCQAVCFTDHRIAFESPDGKRISGNTRGQTFFYFGDTATAEAFVSEFAKFGWCISKHNGWRQ